MPEILESLLERAVWAVGRMWEIFTGESFPVLREASIRIADPRRTIYIYNQIRRLPCSGLNCGR